MGGDDDDFDEFSFNACARYTILGHTSKPPCRVEWRTKTSLLAPRGRYMLVYIQEQCAENVLRVPDPKQACEL